MTTFDPSNLKFEILCIDQEGKVNFSSEKRFIDALSFNEQLWDEIEILENSFGFIDKKKGIKVLIQKLDTSKVISDLFASAFILTIEAKYDNLETLRRILLLHLRLLGFNHLRILNDDVSAYIGTEIYPLINKLENLLRRYTVKFFITKIGLNWWEITVSKEVRDKVNYRKNNEPVLTKTGIINADVSLIDFNDIGEIIYQQKTAFSKVEDIVKKIESATCLEALQTEVQGNYARYFKNYFERTDFEKKWKRCFEIRNKVAHNNLLFQQDLYDAKELIETLTNIVNDADEKIDEVVFTIAEKEAIKIATEQAELVSSQSMLQESERDIISGREDHKSLDKQPVVATSQLLQERLKFISQEKFIEKLAECEREFKNSGKDFVGLRYFVMEILGVQGYSYNSSYAAINILADKRDIEIYDVDNPYGNMPTKAIKVSQTHGMS